MIGRQILEFLLLFIAGALTTITATNLQATTIECHRREFTFRATQTDENGRQCWDHVTAMACWGRCDSGEIGDWRFPYKRHFHPVCLHDKKVARVTLLQNCDPDADLQIAEYEYFEALSCSCKQCDSSSISCQGYQKIPIFDQHSRKEFFSAPVSKPGQFLPVEVIE